MSEKTRWQRYNEEIRERVDYEEVYKSFGVEVTGKVPSASGWLACKSLEKFGGSDRNASAGINVKTGYYKDFRTGMGISLYDFMVEIGEATDWRDAQRRLGDKYGIKPPSISKNHPLHGVEMQPWADNQCKTYCKMKPPITIEGLKKSGAQLCVRYGVPCFVWEIYNHMLEVVGYYFTPRSGQPFKGGAKSIAKKFDGAEAGIIGKPAAVWLAHHAGLTSSDSLENEDTDVHWCEGGPDVVAAYSVLPDGLYFSNPNGCQETITPSQVAHINSANVQLILIADCDTPGVAGAIKRKKALEEQATLISTIHVKAPKGNIEEKHGSDLRDAIIKVAEDNARQENEHLRKRDSRAMMPILQEILEPEKIEQIERDQEKQEERSRQLRLDQSIKVLGDMGITVVARDRDNGVTLYSKPSNRLEYIKRLALWRYEDALMFGGLDFSRRVARKRTDGMMTYDAFMEHVGKVASTLTASSVNLCGAGIWALEDRDNERTGDFLLVQTGELYVVNRSKIERRLNPGFTNITADPGTPYQWFDPEELADLLPRAADPQWRMDVYDEFKGIVGTWKWANEDMPILAAGLAMASMAQSVWDWRPIVTLTGESNSGKSYWLKFLEDLMLGLGDMYSDVTAAGVRQQIKHDAAVMLLDEIDGNHKVQEEILKMFRSSSRNTKTLRGTTTQEAVSHKVRHIPWLAGIFAASTKQADMNRMIELRLRSVDETSIRRPTPGECQTLGHKILAGILMSLNRAYDMACDLSVFQGKQTIQTRYRESYAIPFAMLGAFNDMDAGDVEELMTEYLRDHVAPEVKSRDSESDQEDLLTEILSSHVRLGNGAPRENATVAEILFRDQFIAFQDLLEPQGLRAFKTKGGEHRVAFAIPKMIRNGVLARSKDWSGNAGAIQVLQRLNHGLDPKNDRQMIAGHNAHCISLGYEKLRRWTLKESDGKLFDK